MKAIMVMFDSLNLKMLSTYGCEWIQTPNFERLAKKSVQFGNHYVGSMPCMPARRELHTGRYNFLHRSWGPIEPFDDSMPEMLSQANIYTHLVSDHQHYWEDGGCTYHTRYDSWEFSRGQEGDRWKGVINTQIGESAFKGPTGDFPVYRQMQYHDAMNRQFTSTERTMPQTLTFNNGLEFIETNHQQDNWFVQIETFDPHEPFFAPDTYKEMYPDDYKGPNADWPPYYFVKEGEDVIEHTRNQYAALVSMCDANLGRVLDMMDAKGLWEDTLLIVNTDHGYLLGEHGWWSKTVMPMYNEIAHIPLYIYDPRTKKQGETRYALTQSVDLTATLLDFFDVPVTEHMQSRSLLPVVEKDQAIRDYALFGDHNKHINVTDGEHVYMRSPQHVKNGPSFEYTLMPTHMRARFSVANELKDAVLSEEHFSFSKGAPLLKIPTLNSNDTFINFGTKLFDVKNDPQQLAELDNIEIETKMANLLVRAMIETEAPKEQYERINLPYHREVTMEDIIEGKKTLSLALESDITILSHIPWTETGKMMYRAMRRFMPDTPQFEKGFEQVFFKETEIDSKTIETAITTFIPKEKQAMLSYFVLLAARKS